MIKTIKKANSKWILLFLFGLFSIGAQATEWDENGVVKVYDKVEDYLKDNPCVSVDYDHESVYGEAQLAIYMSGHSDFENSLITNVYDGETPIYHVPISGTMGLNFGGCDYASNTDTPSGFNDSGNWDPYAGGISYGFSTGGGDGSGGTGGGIAENTHCGNKTCPLNYELTYWCACVKKPCNDALKTKINTFANNAIVKTQILALQSSAKIDAFEKSTVINKDATTLALTSPGLGAPGSATSTTITANATTQTLLHSHPDNAGSSTYPTHSPGDIYGLNTAYKAFSNVQYSITVGVTHAYMLVVENPAVLTSFILFNPQATTLIPGTGDFIIGSDFDKVLDDANTVLRNQGESIDSAYASAFAYFLQFKRTGLVLYESAIAADGSTNFHSKNTSSTVTPAQAANATTPAVPEKTTYTNNDCP